MSTGYVIHESADTADLTREDRKPNRAADSQNGPLNERNEPMSEGRKLRTLNRCTRMGWGSRLNCQFQSMGVNGVVKVIFNASVGR